MAWTEKHICRRIVLYVLKYNPEGFVTLQYINKTFNTVVRDLYKFYVRHYFVHIWGNNQPGLYGTYLVPAHHIMYNIRNDHAKLSYIHRFLPIKIDSSNLHSEITIGNKKICITFMGEHFISIDNTYYEPCDWIICFLRKYLYELRI